MVSSEEETVVEREWNSKKKKVEDSRSSSSEVVKWEKFLPRMALRVLLVEADDSTRQIIAALLRKCGYRVAAVPDGLMAWETLRGRPHYIDLILTEIELPSISGYALLTLIMEHEFCKNIPVIMMSSQDSISMVLKCMLKGAADFLIKPIRRNELKNLWQHVWRKHSLNPGHIPGNSPVIKQKAEATSENNSASNHSSACATSSRNNWECSKNESDSQGLLQLKCVTPSNARITETQKYEEGDKVHKRSITPESSSVGRPNDLGDNAVLCYGADTKTALRLGGKSASLEEIESQHATSENNMWDTHLQGNDVDRRIEPSNGAIDLIGTFDGSSKHSYSKSRNYWNDNTNKLKFAPQLELSLNGKFSTGFSSQSQAAYERHALNHSNGSAFSWYNNKTHQPFCPTLVNNPCDIKEGSAKSPQRSSTYLSEMRYGVSQPITISSDNQETVTTLVISQSDQGDLAYPSSLISSASVAGVRLDNCHASSPRALPPLYYPHASVAQVWSPKVPSKQGESTFPTGILNHWNSGNCDLKEDGKTLDEDTNTSVDQIVHEQDNVEPTKEEKHLSPTAGQSSSSSLCNGFANVNGSTPYGSLCSTNDRNVTSAAPAEKSITPESSNNRGPLVCDGIEGMGSQRLSQREAALTKFRLKRKDRCFEKKVRYQSRKRLAEQRPRVKGQFVRQAQDTTMADANA